jgi:hypothetical protein
MKKLSTALAAILLAGGMAAPALADVTAIATIDKTDTITVTEDITITKEANVLVVLAGTIVPGPNGTFTTTPLLLAGAAEANAIVNVNNHDNIVGPDYIGDPDPTHVINNKRLAVIGGLNTAPGGDSVHDNAGIIQLNQDVGDNTNQGNVVALAFTAVQGSFANAETGGDQKNENNTVSERAKAVLPPEVDNTPPKQLGNQFYDEIAQIENSIHDNIGIVGVNQNAGNNNNQTNEVAAAIGVNPQLALAEGALGQVNAHNVEKAENSVKYDEINNSVNDNTGVVNVNQSVGNMNNQMNSFAIAAATSSANTISNIIGSPTQ